MSGRSPYSPFEKGRDERAHRVAALGVSGKPAKLIIAPGYARVVASQPSEPASAANMVGPRRVVAVDEVAEIQVVEVTPLALAESDYWSRAAMPPGWAPRPSLWKRLRAWFRKPRKGGAV